jgi:CubicO group peptidase (beta-lactamase class C family)
MQKNVLQPLGMTNSSYQQPPTATANLATGYYGNEKPVTRKISYLPRAGGPPVYGPPLPILQNILLNVSWRWKDDQKKFYRKL